MRTSVRVEHANCSYCLNAVRDELLAGRLVHDVRMNATAGGLEVDDDAASAPPACSANRSMPARWPTTANLMVTTNRSCPCGRRAARRTVRPGGIG